MCSFCAAKKFHCAKKSIHESDILFAYKDLILSFGTLRRFILFFCFVFIHNFINWCLFYWKPFLAFYLLSRVISWSFQWKVQHFDVIVTHVLLFLLLIFGLIISPHPSIKSTLSVNVDWKCSVWTPSVQTCIELWK